MRNDKWLERLVGTWCLAIAACLPAFGSAEPTPVKNVLVIYGFTPRETFVQLEPLKEAVRAGYPGPVNFYVEFLESTGFGDPEYREKVGGVLTQTYRRKHIDVLVAATYPALQFAVDYRDGISPGAPIAFMSVAEQRLPVGALWPGVTGVTTKVDLRACLGLALKLHPGTKRVVIVAGDSQLERYWQTALHAEVDRAPGELSTVEIPFSKLFETFPQPDSQTIVFWDVVPRDASQPEVGVVQSLGMISKVVQTYCIYQYCVGQGGIGGYITDEARSGKMAGVLVARLLAGEKAEGIAIQGNTANLAFVDARQLDRWKIHRSDLPADAVILFQDVPLWERYRVYLIGAVGGLFLSFLLAFVWRSQRKEQQADLVSLRASEMKWRVLAGTAPTHIWMSDRSGKVTYLNERNVEFTGRNAASDLSYDLTAFIHPDDLQGFLLADAHAMVRRTSYTREYRLRRKDGVYRWMLDVAALRNDSRAKFVGFIGSASDVTDQKIAQETIESTSGRLIAAQEKERNRIARELHDDICQKLAVLSIELEQARKATEETPYLRDKRMLAVPQHCMEIASDVQALSHELHSSQLDVLGLPAALGTFCDDFAKKQDIRVTLIHENIPSSLPRDISLCLFRVTQEALQNAKKHGGGTELTVILRGTPESIQLDIQDQGVGFLVERAREKRGLGLISMQERVHLVRGTFTVLSDLGQGTKIRVLIPLVMQRGADQTYERVESPMC